MVDLTIVKEAVPKIARLGGSGREAEKWEEHLSGLKEDQGEGYRISVHSNTEADAAEHKNKGKAAASNRANSMRGRLDSEVPLEKWGLDVRPIPGARELGQDAKGKPIFNTYGVYATYNGQYTPEEAVARANKRKERSAQVKARIAKAAAEANGSSGKGADSPAPKERVAAAASKAAK